MTAHTHAEAFADAAARLTGETDVAGSLVALLADCVALTDGESAGLLIDVPGDGLALLASTSHTTTILELYELQNGRGPCIQAIRDNGTVTATIPAGLAVGAGRPSDRRRRLPGRSRFPAPLR